MPRGSSLSIGSTFRFAALFEAITWGGLLVGMFLKYVTETTEAGVWLFGRLHGAAFLLYVVVTLIAAVRLRWRWYWTVLALLASIPPLTTLAIEIAYARRGLTGPRPTRQA